jgi:hypothetical protein
MGLFSKIKSNLNHGGIKLDLTAPSSSTSGTIVPVSVNITADSPQTINNVKFELKVETRDTAPTVQFGDNNNTTASNHDAVQTVAQVETNESFTIAAGETKTITLQLGIPNDTVMNNALSGIMGGAVGSIMGKLASMSTTTVSRLYSVHVHADVEGIKLDPGTHQNIQILPANNAPSNPSTV